MTETKRTWKVNVFYDGLLTIDSGIFSTEEEAREHFNKMNKKEGFSAILIEKITGEEE